VASSVAWVLMVHLQQEWTQRPLKRVIRRLMPVHELIRCGRRTSINGILMVIVALVGVAWLGTAIAAGFGLWSASRGPDVPTSAAPTAAQE
jgi:hypothetical protein